MADLVIANKDDLVSIANAIREKAESTDGLVFPAGFVETIANISANSGLFVIETYTPAEDVEKPTIPGVFRPRTRE